MYHKIAFLLDYFQSVLIRTPVSMDDAKKGCQATEVKLHALLTLGAKCGQVSSLNVRMLYDHGRITR
jgi:hypothetical protein